jgi:hypothetical protein
MERKVLPWEGVSSLTLLSALAHLKQLVNATGMSLVNVMVCISLQSAKASLTDS